MALEERIVAWAKTRPSWQREVMARTAAGIPFSDEDYDRVVDDIAGPEPRRQIAFGLENLPRALSGDPAVRLISIVNTEHVNALASENPLSFAPAGLTIVYGDNGSGKSGYARLLKRITGARHQEEVLTDVFRDTAVEQPSASIAVCIGNRNEAVKWPEPERRELQRMHFYDFGCREDYIATDSDFPYRPSALAVMDGLINACVKVRSRIDTKLYENAQTAVRLPKGPDEVKGTEAGTFLDQISGGTQVDTLDELIRSFDESPQTIEELKQAEILLRSNDSSKERKRMLRQAEKLDALRNHIKKLESMLGDDAIATIRENHEKYSQLKEAAGLLARSFASEPLPGVGSSPWKTLWESARRFSEEQAYRGRSFPVLDDKSRCVLCQQTLHSEGRERHGRFEAFVEDDTQTRLEEAGRVKELQHENLSNLVTCPEAVEINLRDLESTYPELIKDIRGLLNSYERTRDQACVKREEMNHSVNSFSDSTTIQSKINKAAKNARELAEDLEDPVAIEERLESVTLKRQELEFLQQIKNCRKSIIKDISRLKERDALEAAKSAAATGPITRKVMEFSEESITDVVRDTFTRETDRLRLERVTIARTRADKGSLLHQPKLVGARQEVKVPRVFSEGERTALGLAAFFTEACLDGSKSAVILDDPITSLDHIRRGLVAARLVALADERQVIMFTHDVAFVADLKLAAKDQGVSIAERSVTRSRANEKKPGACSDVHPWKAKDVSSRFNELRRDLARIKNECTTWDQREYEDTVAVWGGNLSETWERIFSQEIVGPILADGGLEVRPRMVKAIVRFSDADYSEFEASYSRVSQWTKRHDKSALVNYVAPDVLDLEKELEIVEEWFKRVRQYKA